MKRLTFCALVFVIAVPCVVNAYIPSPRYGAFELKFGPYTPNVDDEPGLRGSPYKDVFNNDVMFLTSLELDWQFWHGPGFNLGLGTSVGFMQTYTKEKNEYGVESADYTVLNVIPFSLLMVLRVDVAANELGIPLVPYVKAGLNWHLWWILSGGDVAEFEGEAGGSDRASGGTPGWQVTPGLMLRLDQFDNIAARTFDNEAGINHSYVFVELMFAHANAFGRDGFMHLSPTTYLVAPLS